MLAFFNLIGGVKGVIVLVLIAALGGWAWKQKHDVSVAEEARDTVVAQMKQAEKDRDAAIAVAKTNEDTINQLRDEKKAINDALNTLNTAKETARLTASARETLIQSQSSLPSSSAITAPVISSVIVEVQNDRARRRGLPLPPIESASTTKKVRE
jgi:hypothetical protein